MDTSEASADDKLSTVVEYLPTVPEPYAFEEQVGSPVYPLDGVAGPPIDDFVLGEAETFESADVPPEVNGFFPAEEPGLGAAAVASPPPELEPSTSAPALREPDLNLTTFDEFEELKPTKRSLRAKTRKRIYQEENSEGELPSEDEESLFPRVSSHYYSDDEYVPSKKFKKKESDEYQTEEEEEDEEIVEDLPRRKRRRKKPGEQSTPVKSPKKPATAKKGRGKQSKKDRLLSETTSDDQALSGLNGSVTSDQITVQPVTLDSDSDIENCLQMSKIKVTENLKLKLEASIDSKPNGQPEPKTEDSVKSEMLDSIETKITESKKPEIVTPKESKKSISKESKNSVPKESNISTPKEPKKVGSKKKSVESKKKSETDSEMGKVFENFLTTKTELQIKKVTKQSVSNASPLEIPTIEPPELIKLMDSWTQTEMKEMRSSLMQTSSPYAMRINKTVSLNQQQAENACTLMKKVLTMTTELGTLMCEKSEEFIKKKITPEYIKDTTKVAFCKEKTALLFKLAKDNLTKIEEMLEKNYEEYINDNDLISAVEVDKRITPKMPEEDNSDCEIVEVTKGQPTKKETKKKVGPSNTVFLNKELSIKIAKKPQEITKTTPQGRQIKVSGRHAVWINKSIMVKKVNTNQSFLAQDRRFDKPPDKVIEGIVQDFFEKFKVKTCCEPYTSTEWLVPRVNVEVVCNYFVAADLDKRPSAITTGSGSEDDGFFEGPAGEENVTELNNQYDVVGEPELKPAQSQPQQPRREPESLITLCVRYLHNLLYKPNTGESEGHTHPEQNLQPTTKVFKPNHLLHLCIKQLEKKVIICENSQKHIRKENSENFSKYSVNTHCHPLISSDNTELPSSEVGNTKSPAKLSLICLHVFCKHTKTAMSFNGVSRSLFSNSKSSSIRVNTLEVASISLKKVCYEKIVSMLYQNNVLLDKICDNGNENVLDSEICYAEQNDTEAHSDISLTLSQYENEWFDDVPTIHVKSLKVLCTETVNAMLYSASDKLLKIPAITDIRQINNFTSFIESDEGSVGDDDEYPDDDDEYCEPNKSNWVAKIRVKDLKSFIPQVSGSQVEEESNILEGITLKLEPIDHEENVQEEEERVHNLARVKKEKETSTNDSVREKALASNNMVIVPNINMIPKTERTNEVVTDPLLSNLTEDFMDDSFQEILRRNKLSIQGDHTPPSCESPVDIFTQRHNRRRRQFEPDSDHENDAMELLIPQSFRDFNVQPSNKAKGTLLESSSDNEDKNDAPTKKKRGRPKKNKHEIKNKNKEKEAPPPAPASKEKVHNEIEILTRRMKEKIRNEEKQKESSTDSENDVLYSLKTNNTTPENVNNVESSKPDNQHDKKSLRSRQVRFENLDKAETEKTDATLDKKSLKNKAIEERRSLRSRRQAEPAVDKPTEAEKNTNKKEQSPEFPGFSVEPSNASEMASLRSYMQYIKDKGFPGEDVAPDPSKHLNENGNKDFQNDYNDDDNFNDAGCSGTDIDMSEEQTHQADLPLQKKTNSSEDFDAMAMLTPQCDMVVDEHSKVVLSAVEPKKRGRKKKTKDPKPDGSETKQDSNAAVQNNIENKQNILEAQQNTLEVQQTNIESTQFNTEVIAQVQSAPEISPESNLTVQEKEQPLTAMLEVKKEPEDYTLRDGWKCHKISEEDVKLYQLCYVPMDKLPESFVQTYFQFIQLSRSQEEEDPEIERLTNIKSLHRAPHQKEDGIKRHKPGPKSRTQAYHAGDTNDINTNDSCEYEELEPSDDDHDADKEEPSGEGQIKIKTENTLAKSSLMDGASSGSDNEDTPLIERKRIKQKKAEAAEAVNDPKSLILTADKVMKKELELLHAPVVIDPVRPLNKPQHHDKVTPQKEHKPGTSNRKRRKSDSDASSEEEKQWITTKEKLLKRLEKRNKERLEIDDDKRARIVSDYIEKKAVEKNNAYAGSLISQRRHLRVKRKSRKQKEKELRILQMELQKNMATNGGHFEIDVPIHGKKGAQTSYFKGRRNIRKVIDKKSLARSTVIANMEEIERKRRLSAKQQQLCAHLGCDPSVKAIVINGELCLEYDFEENRPTVAVHQAFTSVMKAHQCEGVKFMWDASFETLERVMYGHPGGGCILAHCMGLGKTLQVLALIHTVMTHKSVGVKRVLVCCPLSTVLNWVDEINKWMGPVTNKIKVFELSKLKKTYERAYQLEEWYNIGGIFIVGYELFRTLTNLHPLVDDIRSTIIDKINTALIDPGPDIVVCDEGHLLKNDCSGLAVAMSRVKTRRRIVLTGTPMQNNLREYYCMVNFVKPNLLGTYSEFSNRFENPVMNGQHRDSSEDDIRLMKFRSHILHKVLEGCLQRQEASVLYPYLPKKYEYTVFISLTKCQSEMYKHYLDNYANKNKQNVLKDFHILQKIWTHPQVLHNFQLKVRDDVAIKDEVKMEDDLGKEELGSEEIKNAGSGGEVWWTQYLEEAEMLDALHTSNKLEAVFSILNECTRVGDKLLIFSTSLLTMDSLEYFLRTINKWSLGHEYYRLDGSVPPEVRQKWCREFNAEHNTNTKLFLISTRAGCLGLNMTAANRVIILDTSWNPAHDIQSIFRVYRFGQRKDCFIYRLVTMGTMEQKIYERCVTKQAVACRVVDEQQIDRHYNMAELTELYSFEETDSTVAPIITAGDALLLSVVRKLPRAVRAVHEHDSLLRDSCDQQLPEHERAAAWAQFQMEQEHTEKQSLAGPKRRKKGAIPVQQAVQIPILTQYPDGYQPSPSCSTLPAIPASFPSPYPTLYPPPYPPPPYDPVHHAQPIGTVPDSPSKRNVVKPKRYRNDSGSSTDSAPADTANDPDWDEQDEKRPLASYQQRQAVYQPIRPAPNVVMIEKGKESAPVRVYSGSAKKTSSRSDNTIVLSDSEQDPPQRPTPKSKIEVGKRILFKTKPPPLAASSRPVPTEDKSKVALHPSLLTNPYFLKIVAHTYRSWNPNLEDEAAMAAAQYSATMLMKKDGEIQSGTLYDIAVKTLGTQTMEVLWKNAQKENAPGPSPKSEPTETFEKQPKMPSLSIAPGKVPTTTPMKDPNIIRPAKPLPIRPAQPIKALKPMEPTISTSEVETTSARSGPLPKLRVKMQESLMKQPPQQPPQQPIQQSTQQPKPVSLHAGAHPSAMPMEMLRSPVELSDGEEESILPDDDTPRIGNASPPPPTIPPPPPVIRPLPPVIRPPPPVAPSNSPPPLVRFTRTARKKTTQGLPDSKPKDSYDVITLPKGQSPAGPTQEIPGQAPKTYTLVRKKATHIMGPNNTITPLTEASTPQSLQTLISTPLSGPIDTTICLDSDDDDDVSPTPDSSTNRRPTNGAPPLILNHTFSQSSQPTIVGGPQRTQMPPMMNSTMPVPTGPILTAQQMQEMQKTGQMPQNLTSPQNISSQMPKNVTPPSGAQMPLTSITNISQLPPNLQSIIQSGKRMGNIILVPANAFKGTNLEGASSLAVVASASSVPQDAAASAQSKIPQLAPKVASTLVAPSAPIDLDEDEITPVVEPAPTIEPVPVSSAVPFKRGRGRPRGGKSDINPGEKLVYTRSAGFVVVKPGQTYEDAMKNSQNNPTNQAPVTVPKQPIPIQPAKPPTPVKETESVQKTPVKHQNQVQEPTSTTADEPTSSVDLTEEATSRKRKRRVASSSSSSSSSSSASSRASSPDTPLSIFKNVVQIQAPTINLDDEPDQPKLKTKSSSKPGLSAAKPGSSLAKPTTNSVTTMKSTSEPSSTRAGKSTEKAGSSKTYPGPKSAKPGTSSAKPSTATSTSTNKSGMVLKKIGSDSASWQQPKMLQKNKPGGNKTPTKDTVDLTDVLDKPNSGAKKKPERLLGMVDLTDLDEPEAKKTPISTEKPAEKTKTNVARSSGVTATLGAKNITLSNTGAITLTKPASSQDLAKPKVTNVMNIKSDVKTASPSKISVISEKRKAPPAPTAPSKKPKKAQPTSLEDFDIDDIMEDIIELE